MKVCSHALSLVLITYCLFKLMLWASTLVLVVPAEAVDTRNTGLSRVRKIPWRRAWQPTLVSLPGDSHGQRSLAGYRPWGSKEPDMTQHLNTHIPTCIQGKQLESKIQYLK